MASNRLKRTNLQRMNPAENNCHLFAVETPSKEGDESGDGDSTSSPIIEEVTVIPLTRLT